MDGFAGVSLAQEKSKLKKRRTLSRPDLPTVPALEGATKCLSKKHLYESLTFYCHFQFSKVHECYEITECTGNAQSYVSCMLISVDFTIV